MRRDLSRFLDTTFDLLVVGAGIHGACIAWDASLRGLSVAIVDRGDFGAATSANSLRIVHGGLRYLARGDFPRMRESIRERSALLRIAPGLVEPLPVLVPTYRRALRGRAAMRTALLLNEIVSLNRNRGLAHSSCIPSGRLVSREECLRLFPWFTREGLTGGAMWYDARLRHPERLTFSFVSSAAARGAVPANYVQADRLILQGGNVEGAAVTDLEGGTSFEIRSRVVVVAAGPWTAEVIAATLRQRSRPAAPRALAVNAVIQRRIAEVAVGSQFRTDPAADPIGGGSRYLFAAPHGDRTLLGTWYAPEGLAGSTPESGVGSLVREFNEVCPGLALSLNDVAGYQWGWLPLKGANEPGSPTALAERPRVVEYGEAQARHLISVEGVKYTTARRVAEKVVDWVFQDLNRANPQCRTAEVPLDGIGADGTPALDQAPEAEVRRAVQEEMAVKLSDIVFRRSTLGTTGRLNRARLAEVARMASMELGWDTMRQQAEVEDVMQTGGFAPAEEPVA